MKCKFCWDIAQTEFMPYCCVLNLFERSEPGQAPLSS